MSTYGMSRIGTMISRNSRGVGKSCRSQWLMRSASTAADHLWPTAHRRVELHGSGPRIDAIVRIARNRLPTTVGAVPQRRFHATRLATAAHSGDAAAAGSIASAGSGVSSGGGGVASGGSSIASSTASGGSGSSGSGIVVSGVEVPDLGGALPSADDVAKYPLWFLDTEGPTYAAIMRMNEHTSEAITAVHEATGLPWWATIIACSLAVRISMVPLGVYSLRNTSRFADAQSDVASLTRAYAHASRSLGAAATTGEKLRTLRLYVSGVRAALRKANCYPWRSFAVPLLQFPPLFAIILGARHLVLMGDETLESGGFGWATDLTVPDELWVLPMMAVSLSYVALEVAFGLPKAKNHVVTANLLGSNQLVQRVKSGIQMWVMITLPFVVNLPAGVFLGWMTAASWSICYMSAIRHPTVYGMLTGRTPPSAREGEREQLYSVTPTEAQEAAPATGEGSELDEGAEASGMDASSAETTSAGEGERRRAKPDSVV